MALRVFAGGSGCARVRVCVVEARLDRSPPVPLSAVIPPPPRRRRSPDDEGNPRRVLPCCCVLVLVQLNSLRRQRRHLVAHAQEGGNLVDGLILAAVVGAQEARHTGHTRG